MDTKTPEQKPFNGHTPLNWTVHEVENNEPDGSRLVTWDISAEDDDGFTFVAEFARQDDADFAKRAVSTYYHREAELQALRDRVERMDEAGSDLLRAFMDLQAFAIANLPNKSLERMIDEHSPKRVKDAWDALSNNP
jgi:hypothetical protein